MIRLLTNKPAHPKDLTALFVVLGAFAVACFSVVPLLGLPGAAILGIAVAVVHPFMSASAWSHLTADVYWLLSIILSVVWPLAILPGYFLTFTRAWHASLASRVTAFTLLSVACGLVLSTGALLLME